jgi:glycosidase
MNSTRHKTRWNIAKALVMFIIFYCIGALASIPSVSKGFLALIHGRASASAEQLEHREPITIILDGVKDANYLPLASDPAGDLGEPGSWIGTQWSDLTQLYIAADENYIYVFVELNDYTQYASTGQIGLTLDVDGNPYLGGSMDPWGNAITFTYRVVDGIDTLAPVLPDYVIRGNIVGIDGSNGWTELRTWNGIDWDGEGVNWGGITTGQIGTHIAYGDHQGVELAIPLVDIGNLDPDAVHLQFYTTQGGNTKGAYDTVPSDDQSATWNDPTTQTRFISVPLAVDPMSDLANPGPGGWVGTTWSDLTRLHIWTDHTSLHLFIPMPDYNPSISEGSFLLALDTKDGGGLGDPWGNAITFAYNTLWQNLGHTPQPGAKAPDYIIRGNLFGASGGDNGWTELRVWNGTDWSTGQGVDWGGIGNSGQPALPGSKVAWSTSEGLRIVIPLVDINIIPGNLLHMEFASTQTANTKGAYDTIPADDQSTGWDDPTIQNVLATYLVPEINQPSASHDNNVWWDELGHDSRDTFYRTPAGPASVNTPVILRLRAASGDLTAAKIRLWNDRTDTQTFLEMSIIADDGMYEIWQATVPISLSPTVYWYRFIAIDGTDVDYYDDDEARLGGWGKAYDESPDHSWQLTIYDPAFQTPDWVKNAIVYQIFPDRFWDGDLINNTPPGTFFYNEVGGTIFRSDPDFGTSNPWNTAVCDPRDAEDCPGTWSKNFYGGDLQGLLDKLDYIQSLGVTAIYLNPIFESPSNHKYDATDYLSVDDNFGNQALFESLATEANNRGIVLILDGVFNHTSSDSIYFDRYGRYPDLGACESAVSPYRDWYFFTDVEPGSGPCVGSDGTLNAATYTSWFGYDSLPKLNSTNPQVRDLIWSGGANAVGRYWMENGRADGWRLDVGGDVDPGTTGDPDNDYWEGFRTAIHTTNPEAYIVGEEWGYATSWTLGSEWDATMNYQFSSALLSFWRDEPFIDNDHNQGSSAGPLNSITPSQLDERLHNLQERYAPEAFYAMLNLLGSHDTNRALFMLDHNTDLNDDELYKNPLYDWSDAIQRLKGVVILQFTLPGAPTIYYGDEVGLVGPVTYDEVYDKWEDDPYNRQPYPWLGAEVGTPFYTHLQTAQSQAELRDHYLLLTTARHTHPALRIGSFDTLLVDDENMVYAFGRRSIPENDAAIVMINRSPDSSQTVTIDISGYLPVGAVFSDALNEGALYTVGPDGTLTISDIPPMFGALLLLQSGNLDVPGIPTNLAASEGESLVELSWEPSAGAVNYQIYRSPVSHGGFEPVDATNSNVFTDTTVANGITYYYVVTAISSQGLESDFSNEASALPHWDIDWANLQTPAEITHTIGLTPTDLIFGRILISDVTGLPGETPGLLAQVGFGPTNTQPANWEWWLSADFYQDIMEQDEFVQQLLPEYIGEYYFVYRYSTTGGRDWAYADLGGIFSGVPVQPGILHVLPSNDTTPPETPTNLHVTNWGAEYVTLAWDALLEDPTIYAYDLFRSETSGVVGNLIARILHPTSVFTDSGLTTGQTYYYIAQALDTSFNRSGYSNEVEATPEPKSVVVTFNVSVPDYTPGTVFIVGNRPEIGSWDPGAIAMTPSISNSWTITRTFMEGTELEYKFTRGSWDKVEKQADGNQEIENRKLIVQYGSNGQQLVNLAVVNWRDPLVVSYSPPANATDVPTSTQILVTWNQSMTIDSNFHVIDSSGEVSGTFVYNPDLLTTYFTPLSPLDAGTVYTVTVSNQVDIAGDVQQVPATWNFTTIALPPPPQIKLNYFYAIIFR